MKHSLHAARPARARRGGDDADPKPREAKPFTRYLHVMNNPGLGIPSPLDG